MAATALPTGPGHAGTCRPSACGKDGCAERKPLWLASNKGADPDSPALLSLQEPLKQRKPIWLEPWPVAACHQKGHSLCASKTRPGLRHMIHLLFPREF